MNIKQKAYVAYFAGVLIASGISLAKLGIEWVKVSKRIKRNGAFLAESEAWKKKYHDCPEDQQEEAIAEFKKIMDRYDI